MSSTAKQLINNIMDKIKHHKVLYNMDFRLRDVTDTVKKRLFEMQTATPHVYNNVLKQTNNSSVKDPLSSKTDRNIVETWKNWYKNTIGLHAIEEVGDRVSIIQQKFFNCQENRRNLSQQVFIINGKLKCIYSELTRTDREDQKFVQLTMMENETLREQKRIMEQIKLIENEEKEYFTQLALAMKEYQECQGHIELKLKFFQIRTYIIAAIVSTIGSFIIYRMKVKHDGKILNEMQKNSEYAIAEKFDLVRKKLDSGFAQINKQIAMKQEFSQPNIKSNRADTNQSQKSSQESSQTTWQSVWNSVKSSPYVHGTAIFILLKIFGI